VVLEAKVVSSCSKSVVLVEAVVVDHQGQLVVEALKMLEELPGSPTTTGGVAIQFPIKAVMAIHINQTWHWDYLGRTPGKHSIGLASGEGMQLPHVEPVCIHPCPNLHDTVGLSLLHISNSPTAESEHERGLLYHDEIQGIAARFPDFYGLSM